MFGKKQAAILASELLGTGILTLMVLSVQRSTIGVPFFVALGAGIALALTVYALHEHSGAHFNPALTIGLWTARKISTVTAALYVVVQLLGAWGAYYLYTYFVNQPLQPIGGHYSERILIAEAVGAAIFSFGVASTVYRRYTGVTAAAFTGVAYMLGVVVASSASIGLINPALALGVRAWVWGTYVAGPIAGAIIGVNLYGLLFAQDPEAATAPAAAAKPVAATAAKPAAKKAPAKKPAAKKKTAAKKK